MIFKKMYDYLIIQILLMLWAFEMSKGVMLVLPTFPIVFSIIKKQFHSR